MAERVYKFLETSDKARPIKAWVDGVPVEDAAHEQLKRIAQMPFVHPWVSVMPDVHLGKGATVGSVIPTIGAIIPAAVGVDIGCFTGDTKIPLLDGKEYELRALAEKGQEIFVYACLPEGKIVAAKATAKLTRTNAALVEVTLDSGDKIRCTPEHQFMLRDGTYREAKDLAPKTSLMPFYTRIDRDGYQTVRQPYSGSDQRSHWVVARAGLMGEIPGFKGQKTVIHHKDFTETNNLPSNLQFMGDKDHSTYHRSLVENNQHWQSEEFERKRIEAIRARAQDPVARQQVSEQGTKNILAYMQNNPEHFKEAVAENGDRGKKYLLSYNTSERGRAKSKEVSNKLQACEFCGTQAKSWIGLYNHKKTSHGIGNNHKIVSVCALETTEDVYCLTVPEHHNFALAAGVFVHNCGMIASRTTLKASDLPDNLKEVRSRIEAAVPHGRTDNGGPNDRGAWRNPPKQSQEAWEKLKKGYEFITDKHKRIGRGVDIAHLGTLGTGNHFIEICLDKEDRVWIMLHSGSRGVGNRVGSYFIELAKEEMRRFFINLPDMDLSYLPEGSQYFNDYVNAVGWAQSYAAHNRAAMMENTIAALRGVSSLPPFDTDVDAVNCFATETKVMTRNGSFEIGSLSGASHEVLTSGGDWVEAEVRSFGVQHLRKMTLSRSGVEKVLYVTPEHRWLIRDYKGCISETTTDELRARDRLAFVFPKRHEAPGVAREGAARGFVFGDGSRAKAGSGDSFKSRANFCGKKDLELLHLFEGLGRPPRFYEKLVVINGLPPEWKTELPSLLLGSSVLYGWLAGYFAADGDVDVTGRPTLASSKRENLEHVRELCNRIGVGTFGIRMRMRKGFGAEETPLFMLGLMRGDLTPEFFLLSHHRERFLAGRNAPERRGWNVVSVEPTDRYEEVFCAVVLNTHTFALEDNILTGNCHHNYISKEHHYGKDVWVTRKGAVSAAKDQLGIIPGSMGARSYIVRGLGNPESFNSCSHGAGRKMSRTEAKKKFTMADHAEATKGIECRKDEEVIDETPMAYKSIEDVMRAQRDLVEVVHELRQVVCVKG